MPDFTTAPVHQWAELGVRGKKNTTHTKYRPEDKYEIGFQWNVVTPERH